MPIFHCVYCGFETDDFQEMDTHVSSKGHGSRSDEDQKSRDGKRVEAGSTPEESIVVRRESDE